MNQNNILSKITNNSIDDLHKNEDFICFLRGKLIQIESAKSHTFHYDYKSKSISELINIIIEKEANHILTFTNSNLGLAPATDTLTNIDAIENLHSIFNAQATSISSIISSLQFNSGRKDFFYIYNIKNYNYMDYMPTPFFKTDDLHEIYFDFNNLDFQTKIRKLFLMIGDDKYIKKMLLNIDQKWMDCLNQKKHIGFLDEAKETDFQWLYAKQQQIYSKIAKDSFGFISEISNLHDIPITSIQALKTYIQLRYDIQPQILEAELFRKNISQAWSQYKYRAGKSSKVPLNTYLDKNIKKQLTEIQKKLGMNLEDSIEVIINDAYMRTIKK